MIYKFAQLWQTDWLSLAKRLVFYTLFEQKNEWMNEWRVNCPVYSSKSLIVLILRNTNAIVNQCTNNWLVLLFSTAREFDWFCRGIPMNLCMIIRLCGCLYNYRKLANNCFRYFFKIMFYHAMWQYRTFIYLKGHLLLILWQYQFVFWIK